MPGRILGIWLDSTTRINPQPELRGWKVPWFGLIPPESTSFSPLRLGTKTSATTLG